MAQFTDALGRDWSIVLDVPTVRRIRGEFGTDLLDLQTYLDLKDPCHFVTLLYALLAWLHRRRWYWRA